MGKEIGPQRLRLAKRLVLTPVAGHARTWALSGEASRVKLLVLRRVVLPGVAAARCWFERPLPGGLVFRANSQDFLPATVSVFGVWEPVLTEFLRRRLQPGRVFVDVGANLGWFTINAARWLAPSGTVVAIEPVPALFEQLNQQLDLNALENVRAVNEAVSEKAGWVRIDVGPREHTGLSRVVAENGFREGAIRARSLAEMLSDNEISRCRVVKIDVEGSEYGVVKGMHELLAMMPPDVEVIVEVGPARASSPEDVGNLFAVFRDRNFFAYEMPNTYSVREWRDPQLPTALARVSTLPTKETDIVFSRLDAPALPL